MWCLAADRMFAFRPEQLFITTATHLPGSFSSTMKWMGRMGIAAEGILVTPFAIIV